MNLKSITNYITRNKYSINGEKSQKNIVNMEWWNQQANVGDFLATIVYGWMLAQRGIEPNTNIKQTKHLLTIGSILSMGRFDATVWGSGIHVEKSVTAIFRQSSYRKYDIRSVRGPVTQFILNAAGYKCPSIFGDPAILMPLIYRPKDTKKKYDVSLIKHLSTVEPVISDNIHFINVKTEDYKEFIDEIVHSKKVISSSLHGIILAEAYGIPAIFLNEGMDNEIIKFFDWYLSTGRSNIQIARSVDEAVQLEPMKLPNLSQMQKNIMKAFPYDLWE